jgi:hypothetical protein
MVRYTKKKRRGRPKGYTDDEARLVLSAALSGGGLDNWSDLRVFGDAKATPHV